MEVLLTGGCGDILAAQSHWAPSLRNSITRIFWASRRRELLAPIFWYLYPRATQVVAADDFSTRWAYISAKDLPQPLPLGTEDWSLNAAFPRILKGIHPFTGSSLLTTTIADTSHFPSGGFVIAHSTPLNKPQIASERSFGESDWEGTQAILRAHRAFGVVLGTPDGEIPQSPYLIDLRGKTTIAESTEILKQSRGYFGVDTWLSVLAAQLFPSDLLWIKSRPAIPWQEVFFAPHTSFPFLDWTIHPR